MNSSRLLFALFVLAAVVTGCDRDTDTPPAVKRSSYYNAPLVAAPQKDVKCAEGDFSLPASSDGESLGVYILKIHDANQATAIATMSMADLQTLYVNCLRPALVERLRPTDVSGIQF